MSTMNLEGLLKVYRYINLPKTNTLAYFQSSRNARTHFGVVD